MNAEKPFPHQLKDDLFEVALHLMTPHNDDPTITREEELQMTKDLFQNEIQNFKEDRHYNPDPYPYYKFLPKYIGEYPPGRVNIISGRCFNTINIQSNYISSGNVTIDFTLNDKLESNCSESFIISTGAETKVKTFLLDGTHSTTLQSQETIGTDANRWDLYVRGPRIFHFPLQIEDAIQNLAATAVLHESHDAGKLRF